MLNRFLTSIFGSRNERVLRQLGKTVTQINALVYKLNTLGTNALSSDVTGVDMETELSRLRERCTS